MWPDWDVIEQKTLYWVNIRELNKVSNIDLYTFKL